MVRAQANPACPDRITWESMEHEYSTDTTPGKAEFARERCSIWPNRPPLAAAGARHDVDMELWGKGAISDRLAHGKETVLAVAMGRGGGYLSIVGAQRTEDDRILLEHLATEAGTLWVAEELKSRREDLGARLIVLDEKQCATIITDLQKARIPFMKMNMSEVAAAFDLFVEYVNADLVRHPDQEEVTISLTNAVPRTMNGPQKLRTWDQGDPEEPVTQVQAATLALWAVKKLEARETKPAPTEPQALEPAPAPTALAGLDLMTTRF